MLITLLNKRRTQLATWPSEGLSDKGCVFLSTFTHVLRLLLKLPYVKRTGKKRNTGKGKAAFTKSAVGCRHTSQYVTTEHSLDLGADFTEGGKPDKNPPEGG